MAAVQIPKSRPGHRSPEGGLDYVDCLVPWFITTGISHSAMQHGGYRIAFVWPDEVTIAAAELSARLAELLPGTPAYPSPAIHSSVGNISAANGRLVDPDSEPRDRELLDGLVDAVEAALATGLRNAMEARAVVFEPALLAPRMALVFGRPQAGYWAAHQAIHAACRSRGIDLVTSWGPHLTLTRFARPASAERLTAVVDFRRTYRRAVARLTEPATARLRPTATRLLQALGEGGTATVEELTARIGRAGRALNPTTIQVGLEELRAVGLATTKADTSTTRWSAASPTRPGVLDDVEPHGAHDFRHTFSTWLEDAGIPTRVIDELMGHQRSRRAELEGGSRIGARYRHTTSEMGARVVAAIEARLRVVLEVAEAPSRE